MSAREEYHRFILERADRYVTEPFSVLTDAAAPMSEGTIHDYYSNGDYWWPNPDTEDGLPYVKRDGESNPENFQAHRRILREMRTRVSFLTAAESLSGRREYGERAREILVRFLLAPETRMNPSLEYAQAIPGVCKGRGIGIIDTLHLVELPYAIDILWKREFLKDADYEGLKTWFRDYLHWLWHSKKGCDERSTKNNHSICYYVQVASFARFVGNDDLLKRCREAFQTVLLKQMDERGAFPRELARTKPYNYSIFALDNMVTLCQILSEEEPSLWDYTTKEGRSLRLGIQFLLPYLLDKGSWPYPPDVEHFDAFPQRTSMLLFGGTAYQDQRLLSLYHSLPLEQNDEEALRNAAIRIPELMMLSKE